MSAPAVKILLIYPPSRTQSHRSCPMGMLMLAAVLEKAGYQVHLLDANAANHRLTTERDRRDRRGNAARRHRDHAGDALGEGSVPAGFSFAAVRRQTDRRRTARHLAAGRTARQRLRRRGGGRRRADHRRGHRGRARPNADGVGQGPCLSRARRSNCSRTSLARRSPIWTRCPRRRDIW